MTLFSRTRGRAALFALAISAFVVAVVTTLGGEDPGPYRVHAIFDAARGVGPGQVVKIAGARVGTVEDVTLTDDFKARVIMDVERDFGPFRADASCAIRPEGLITENFVDCRPGTPQAGRIGKGDDGVDTVPVERTTAPVALSDLFKVFEVPTPDRLAALLNELGISTAGRGQDINAILYRANPTLREARRVVDIVDRQRDQLLQLLEDARPVLQALAERDDDVRRFLRETRRLTRTTANGRDELALAIERLPALLEAARPALEQLATAAEAAPPTLRALREAAPALERATTDLEPFAREAARTLDALDPSLRATRTALERARPVLRKLLSFARKADPVGRDLMRLLVDLRDAGAVENLLKIYYSAAGATNRFDAESHLLVFAGTLNPCMVYALVPLDGCVSRLDGADYSGTVPALRARERRAPRERRAEPAARSTPAPPSATATVAPRLTPTIPPRRQLPQVELPKLPELPIPTPSTSPADAVDDLLDSLLGP